MNYQATAAIGDFWSKLTLRPKQKAQALDPYKSLEIMRGRMPIHLSQFIQSLGAHPLTFSHIEHKYSPGNGAEQGRPEETLHI